MAAIKLSKFLGTAPKIASELLPNSAGQIAYNLQLYSGDLVPYSEPAVIDSVPRLGTLQTLHGMRASAGASIDWITWLADVDIAVASDSSDAEQRFYYTGDGVPKVTNYTLATTGSEPYPGASSSFYDLGLPLPTATPTTSAASFTASTSASRARDSGNSATLVTGTAHGLRTGNVVTIRSFTSAPADDWNVVNAYVTVTDTTTFTYYNTGDTVTTAADTSGTVDLAGNTQTVIHTYTWLTSWGEESIAADPSTELYVKEGQQLTVTGLPTAAPSGDNFISGLRVYRTVGSASGTLYYRLITLRFPLVAATAALASNVVTITMSNHHNLIVDDRFKIAKSTDSTFDIIDGIVLSVPDDNTFTYAQTASDITEKAEATATLYHDAAELITGSSRYWGDDSIEPTLVERNTSVVTLTTAVAHGLLINQKITVSGMTDASYDESTEVAVASVPSTTSITYISLGGIAVSTIARASNVVTVTTAAAHGFSTSDVVTMKLMTDSTFDSVDESVTVTDATHFTYAQTGDNVGTTADTTGRCQRDDSSKADTAGLITNDSFTDDFDVFNLSTSLTTSDYDAPNAAMIGISVGPNGILFGFFDNQLCFAEPDQPHAWPVKYRKTIEEDIVGAEAIGGYILVLTAAYAYRVSGNDPATMSIARIDTPYPCLSKKSIVNMGYGVLYATYGGLAMWSSATNLTLATKYIHDWDTWDDGIDPSTIVGHFFNDKYFGSYTGGSFLFERDEKVGGYYITAGHQFNSAWTDVSTNALYTASDTLGSITQWGSSTWPLRPMEWKSKTIVTKDYINIGAARVIADYTITTEDAAAYTTYNDGIVAYNTAVWADSEQLGGINGPTDYVDTSGVEINNFGDFNRGMVNGPSGLNAIVRSTRTAPSAYAVVFKLWQDKNLVFTQSITSDAIFRCPAGYKSDTFEVSVSGSARVRAIHMGETPDGLRKA
tara:strand:- start:1169 stop:4012 length:2844 start_codon:yes stop_codon:yes gene_type:complete